MRPWSDLTPAELAHLRVDLVPHCEARLQVPQGCPVCWIMQTTSLMKCRVQGRKVGVQGDDCACVAEKVGSKWLCPETARVRPQTYRGSDLPIPIVDDLKLYAMFQGQCTT